MSQRDQLHAGFHFPELGNTGEGGRVLWRGPVWTLPGTEYAVTRQGDRPACAYRCHYPGGAAPCTFSTAMAFIEHVTRAYVMLWQMAAEAFIPCVLNVAENPSDTVTL